MPTPCSGTYLQCRKAAFRFGRPHSESPHRTFVHCEGFVPAAPRRVRLLVSEADWQLPLSRLLLIIGLVSSYLTNDLISCGPILWRRNISQRKLSSNPLISGISLTLARLFPSIGQVSHMLLSYTPRTNRWTSMAKSDSDSGSLWQDQPELPTQLRLGWTGCNQKPL